MNVINFFNNTRYSEFSNFRRGLNRLGVLLMRLRLLMRLHEELR
jgi:hypothetical protein